MALKLKGSTSGFTAIDAPAVAGDNTLVLPGGNGTSGQYLQTDGSGVLSWQTVSVPDAPAILQVLQDVKTNIFSTSNNITNAVEITGLSQAVTMSVLQIRCL